MHQVNQVLGSKRLQLHPINTPYIFTSSSWLVRALKAQENRAKNVAIQPTKKTEKYVFYKPSNRALVHYSLRKKMRDKPNIFPH